MRVLLATLALSCVRPLPLPPSPEIDYCHQPGLVLTLEDWRGLCGAMIFEAPLLHLMPQVPTFVWPLHDEMPLIGSSPAWIEGEIVFCEPGLSSSRCHRVDGGVL